MLSFAYSYIQSRNNEHTYCRHLMEKCTDFCPNHADVVPPAVGARKGRKSCRYASFLLLSGIINLTLTMYFVPLRLYCQRYILVKHLQIVITEGGGLSDIFQDYAPKMKPEYWLVFFSSGYSLQIEKRARNLFDFIALSLLCSIYRHYQPRPHHILLSLVII